MKVEQLKLSEKGWREEVSKLTLTPTIFLLFASPKFPELQELVNYLKLTFPETTIAGCSTAGEISDISVSDNSVSCSAIQLESAEHVLETVNLKTVPNSFNAGEALAKKLKRNDLQHVLVLSDGLNVNGAEIIKGLKSVLPQTSITGGLAADGSNFEQTFVIYNNVVSDNIIIGLGFCGEGLQVGYSSKGGWDSFGMERMVTKSDGNILYELDGQPALDLYKSFLGDNAKNLPSSGLLFPLSMRVNESDSPVVRTILGVNEKDHSLTFAGDIPEGAYVRLMKANIDRLINGAEDSAKKAIASQQYEPELAILVSCVGRRLVLKQLVEEEVEAVREIIGHKPKITGFYSYGEIAPFGKFSPCELHNQTMTITTLSEC